MPDPFPCSRCGLCCQHLDLNPLYAALDRGDGVCFHYASETKSCSIYESRPSICRIDESYVFFASHMKLVEYQQANLQGCKNLQDRFRSI